MGEAQVPAEELRRQAALYKLAMLDGEPEEEFDRIARLAQRLLSTTSALVSFMDHDRQWYKARVGVETHEAARPDTFCTHVIEDDAAMVVQDATQDPRFAENPHVLASGGVRFYAGVPIHSPGGYAVGTLCVFDPAPRAFDDADLAPLLDLAAMVDDIIEARVSATVDVLTGLQNRAGFLRAAQPLLRLADRTGMTMTLGFLDINGLKRINDDLGHEAGDAAIATVGNLLGTCFRAADVVGRIGGDEFVVLMAADADGAAVALSRLESGLAASELSFPVGVAAGFVTRDPDGPGIEALLAQADTVMYERKRSS